MKLFKNSDGFSPLHALLIIVILGIVGFTGWYVWNVNNKATDNLESANTNNSASVEDASNETKDKTLEWFNYASPNGKYTIKLPDGWKLDVEEGGSAPYTKDSKNIVYKGGTLATVTSSNFAGDILHVAFAMSDSAEGFFGQDPGGVKHSVFKTDQGAEVIRYDLTVENDPEDLPTGMLRHEYRVTRDGKTFQVIHDVLKGETDKASLVEDAIHTLELN